MLVRDASKITLGAFLNFGKYENPNVREFYNKMIMNIVRGLRMTMHRVDNVEDLQKLLERVKLTHLFVAEDEYEKNRAYLETLAQSIQLVVIARESLELPRGSRAQIMPKPFYCIPVVSVLNAERGSEKTEEGRMRCDGIRALVVDDEPMNLSVAKGIFKRYGMEVKTANSGEEAIRACSAEEFDLVFMDHMMPGMDGVEAMKHIRYEVGRNKHNFAVIALTANCLSTAREMFIAEGFDGFVSKPIELTELERVLKHVLPSQAITYGTDAVEASKEEATQEQAKEERQGEEAVAKESGTLSDVGIDESVGLKYCEKDEELYDSLLKQYAEEAVEKKEKMGEAFEKKDFKNYAILVHALKSTSLMIGAAGLSEKAKAQELAAKQEDAAYVEAHHEELMAEYERTTEAIRKAKQLGSAAEEEIFEFYPGAGN